MLIVKDNIDLQKYGFYQSGGVYIKNLPSDSKQEDTTLLIGAVGVLPKNRIVLNFLSQEQPWLHDVCSDLDVIFDMIADGAVVKTKGGFDD